MMESDTADTPTGTIHFRAPVLKDGALVHRFIDECGVLEINTAYCYFLLCSHFSGGSAIAERDGEIVGFLGGYRIPDRPDTYFVWQVGVSQSARGHGLAGRLIDHVIERPENRDVRFVEATVSPENTASAALFRKWGEKRNAEVNTETFLTEDDFLGGGHSAEILHRIGPF